MPEAMQWSSVISKQPSLEAAITEVADRARNQLQAPATLGFLFVSSAFASEYPRVMPLIRRYFPDLPIVGCGGAGVIGTDAQGVVQEVEEDILVSFTLAALPNVAVHTFHVETDELPDLDSSPNVWVDLIGVAPTSEPQFVVFIDPMSEGINDLLAGLDYAYPGMPKVGGLASAGFGATRSGLFCGDRFYRSGAVGVALSGNIVLDTIVAQGCRPIGSPYWVTESERNVILGLKADGDADQVIKPPLEILRDIVSDLGELDQELAKEALFVGIAQNAFKQTLEPGDFLVRNLLGFDPRQGALAIGDRVRAGQRIQFHLRDASASAEDLEVLMRRYRKTAMGKPKSVGALMFACIGRGKGLYGESNFDSGVFEDYVPIPLAGFFCNGEIGPIEGTTFLHGYTSVFGIVRSKEAAE
jgi:small ligand-binding sensory domain FIST